MQDYNMEIQMVDLKGQYKKIKSEVDAAIQDVIDTATFINGPQVKRFEAALGKYLDAKFVIGCANGTDALQIASMALGLKAGDEVIVPCFTYVATAEVIGLLGLTPVLVEVDPDTFNSTAEIIKGAITDKTKAIVPVHLYGQCADMEAILELAALHNLFVIEDAAQAMGAEYTFSDGSTRKAGAMGNIGCTSFFPSKNLGCYGDGGALITNDESLATQIRIIANHGQRTKYYHEILGVNSRLDTIQAAILSAKLPHLDSYAAARNAAAAFYDQELADINWLQVPVRSPNSTHVFHQYTIKLADGIDRDDFKKYLQSRGVPSMVYYPLPLHKQEAFRSERYREGDFPVSENLCRRVISLPIHTEMTAEELSFITATIKAYPNVR